MPHRLPCPLGGKTIVVDARSCVTGGCTGVGVRVWVCTGRRDCRNDLQFANHSDVPEVGLMEYVVS